MWNFVLMTRPAFRRDLYQADTSFIGTQRRTSLIWGVLAAHPPDPPSLRGNESRSARGRLLVSWLRGRATLCLRPDIPG